MSSQFILNTEFADKLEEGNFDFFFRSVAEPGFPASENLKTVLAGTRFYTSAYCNGLVS